ncbi:MAG: hypothetical protein IKQ46_10500 [Bacteroidales bacterium]|nr:hypothetical protein [Bacteroidales bacterium]
MRCDGDCFNCEYDDCRASDLEISFLDDKISVNRLLKKHKKEYIPKRITKQKKELTEIELAYIKNCREKEKKENMDNLWIIITNF